MLLWAIYDFFADDAEVASCSEAVIKNNTVEIPNVSYAEWLYANEIASHIYYTIVALFHNFCCCQCQCGKREHVQLGCPFCWRRIS